VARGRNLILQSGPRDLDPTPILLVPIALVYLAQRASPKISRPYSYFMIPLYNFILTELSLYDLISHFAIWWLLLAEVNWRDNWMEEIYGNGVIPPTLEYI
jgi:hypothetical protein